MSDAARPRALAKPYGGLPGPQTDSALARQPTGPWQLPAEGLAVFHGPGDTARLSHYFLPRLLVRGQRVLFLDGANSADPRLIERFARERGVEFQEFSQRMKIARAFTCFQLTELIARLPQLLRDFPAQVVIVTAFPDLYFDEDVRDWDARVAFEQALGNLQRSAGALRGVGAPGRLKPADADLSRSREDSAGRPGATVAVFSSASSFAPLAARRHFFAKTCAAATEVWKFGQGEGGRPKLFCERRALPWKSVTALGASPEAGGRLGSGRR